MESLPQAEIKSKPYAEGFYAILPRMKTMLTTKEAGVALGISTRRVRQLIAEGRLPAKKVGRDYVIDPRGLKAVENRQTGRPKKTAK